jgi:hypothetical protein
MGGYPGRLGLAFQHSARETVTQKSSGQPWKRRRTLQNLQTYGCRRKSVNCIPGRSDLSHFAVPASRSMHFLKFVKVRQTQPSFRGIHGGFSCGNLPLGFLVCQEVNLTRHLPPFSPLPLRSIAFALVSNAGANSRPGLQFGCFSRRQRSGVALPKTVKRKSFGTVPKTRPLG